MCTGWILWSSRRTGNREQGTGNIISEEKVCGGGDDRGGAVGMGGEEVFVAGDEEVGLRVRHI